eukprot:4306314-Pleurochrysis_carterae.AAC.1
MAMADRSAEKVAAARSGRMAAGAAMLLAETFVPVYDYDGQCILIILAFAAMNWLHIALGRVRDFGESADPHYMELVPYSGAALTPSLHALASGASTSSFALFAVGCDAAARAGSSQSFQVLTPPTPDSERALVRHIRSLQALQQDDRLVGLSSSSCIDSLQYDLQLKRKDHSNRPRRCSMMLW